MQRLNYEELPNEIHPLDDLSFSRFTAMKHRSDGQVCGRHPGTNLEAHDYLTELTALYYSDSGIDMEADDGDSFRCCLCGFTGNGDNEIRNATMFRLPRHYMDQDGWTWHEGELIKLPQILWIGSECRLNTMKNAYNEKVGTDMVTFIKKRMNRNRARAASIRSIDAAFKNGRMRWIGNRYDALNTARHDEVRKAMSQGKFTHDMLREFDKTFFNWQSTSNRGLTIKLYKGIGLFNTPVHKVMEKWNKPMAHLLSFLNGGRKRPINVIGYSCGKDAFGDYVEINHLLFKIVT